MAKRSRNVAAFERFLVALKKGGRLEDADAALVGLGRTLAELLDQPEEPVVQTAWAYKAVVRELRGAPSAGDDDSLAQILSALQTPLGDAEES